MIIITICLKDRLQLKQYISLPTIKKRKLINIIENCNSGVKFSSIYSQQDRIAMTHEISCEANISMGLVKF